MSVEQGLNHDFRDMLRALADVGAEFLVVGAHALAAHGIPRATGDLDLFVRPSSANARCVLDALRRFGAPIETHGIREDDFTRPGTVYQIGLPPRRIDLLTEISGVSFDEAWDTRLDVTIDGRPVGFIGREALLRNKRAAGRPKDLVDADLLEKG